MAKTTLKVVVIVMAGVWLAAGPALAQAPTGTISGHVVSADGEPLPGVTASVMSPNLQGVRTTTTSINGDYLVPFLPPGAYTIAFEINGFQTVREVRGIAGTQNVVVNATMALASVRESVTVIGDAQPFVATAQVATNFKQELMATLPSNRTIDAVLLMAPALHATGPRGAYTINGSQSYENLFTLDGAVINENLRGAPMTPYIEDALQEVTVSSSGVSAEYGRFAGGVANAITKSGGNLFSGSFRSSFGNDSWRSLTPYESTLLIADPSRVLKIDKTVPTYEATFGGPIMKERLWFFSAVRKQNQETSRTTSGTNISFARANDEKRYEGKITYTARPGHTIQGSAFAMDQVLRNNSGFNVMDLKSLTNQGQPQSLVSLHYTGVVGRNLFLEAQYSARRLKFTEVGADKTDLIGGTLVLDLLHGWRYWSPSFCAGSTCGDGDEERNNDNVVVKGSVFHSDRWSGSHHLVFGYDRFNDKIKANTHASGSDYRIRGTSSIVRGADVYPQFLLAGPATTIDWNPLEQLSEGSNLRVHSLFVNDNWRPNEHFGFGIGVRLDKNQATNGDGSNVGDDLAFSPRLSAIWDPAGDGKWGITGSFARYGMALTSNLAGSTAKGGNAATYRWLYQGPAINPDPTAATLVTTEQAIAQVFKWFEDNGGKNRTLAAVSVPGVTMQIQEPLTSPYAIEYAGGVSRTLGARGTARVDYTYREFNNFYSLHTDLSTGRVSDGFTNFDLSLVENTNATERRYAGLAMQVNYGFGESLLVGGNYTLSHAQGNLEGETVNGGPSGALADNYPEYRQESWNYPTGDLLIDQRHRSRIWATYTAPVGAGTLTFGMVQQIGSGVPYAAVGSLDPRTYVTNPGYLTPPTAIEYYFTERDAFRTETTYRSDISVNYGHRLGRLGASQPQLFFHGELLNLFNQFQLCGCGANVFSNGGITDLSTISTATQVLSTFNPYTTQPVRGVNWQPAATFGQAINAFAYTSPRIFRFSVGVRF